MKIEPDTQQTNGNTGEIPEIIILTCENFYREARAAISELGLEKVGCAAFPARCGRPPVTWEELHAAAGPENNAARLAVFGGCCLNRLKDSAREDTPFSLKYVPQCFEMLAGKTFIENLVKQGAFLTTPGWLGKWRQWIEKNGFDQVTARAFFKETTSSIMLLDTGVDEAAGRNLADFADFIELPAHTMPAGIDIFKVYLHRRVLMERQKIQAEQAETDKKSHRQEQAEFAMALDLLSDLPKATSEKEAFDKTLNVFNMLFAPEEIIFAEIENGKEPRLCLLSGAPETFDPVHAGNRIAAALRKDRLVRSEQGFTLRMASRENIIRGIEARDIAFPEYMDRYEQTARTIADVCSLAIDNARSYEMLKESENRMRKMATTDHLTQVNNRACFMEKTEQEINRIDRYGGAFAMIMLDVDHFKQVNDTFGHSSGDAVLKAIASVCSGSLRENDIFGRIGGEEFAAGIIETGLESGIAAAERMRKSIADHNFEGEANGIRCTASLGVTAYRGAGDTLEKMLKRADEAMYQAKDKGRNRTISLP